MENVKNCTLPAYETVEVYIYVSRKKFVLDILTWKYWSEEAAGAAGAATLFGIVKMVQASLPSSLF